MLVLAILVGLAGVTLPRMKQAEESQQLRELDVRLETVRTAIEAYREEHDGAWPGTKDGVAEDESFSSQLTETTDGNGIIDPNGSYGPYLETVLPTNPLNGLTAVHVVRGRREMQPDGRSGWLFDLETGRFAANSAGFDDDGAAHVDR